MSAKGTSPTEFRVGPLQYLLSRIAVSGTAGNLLRRMSSGAHQEGSVGGRPLQEHEQIDDGEDGEDLMRSSSMMDWIRSFDDSSFDPDMVPDAAMADYLGGTVSVAANRPGVCLPVQHVPLS